MTWIIRWLALSCLFSLVVLSTGYAQEVVVEQRFEALTGEPVVEEMTFDGSGYADFVIRVENGSPDGMGRVFSATLSLNGVKLLGPSDFNLKVGELERVIVPIEGENSLEVNLRSNPGGFLIVRVLASKSFNLPPDPGEAGDATLEGVDVNGNGIRDDIERWIYLTCPDSEKERLALIQKYQALQNMLIRASENDRDGVYDGMTALQRAGECIRYVNVELDRGAARELKARMVNTDVRMRAHISASRMLGGGTFPGRHPSLYEKSCNFDVNAITD